jgi:hypothetical protein
VCLVAGDGSPQDSGRAGAVSRACPCAAQFVGWLADEGCLGADVGKQVVGEQLCEGFGQFNVLDAAVTVQVERFEQALVDLPPDAWRCCRVMLVVAACHGQGSFELRRDRGYFFLARRTSSLALAGEPDEAASAGLEAVQIASSTTSQRTNRELMRALATLQPWRNRPGPRALRNVAKHVNRPNPEHLV